MKSDATPTHLVRYRAQQQGAEAECDRHHEEARYETRSVEALDIGEPRRRPQSLERPGRPDAGCRKRRQSPEAWIPIDGFQAGRSRAFRRRFYRSSLWNYEVDHHRTGGCRSGEKLEEPAPARPLEQSFGWSRCGNRTQCAEHDHIAVDERHALPRKPQNDGLEPCHQCGCDPEPNRCSTAISFSWPRTPCAPGC